jgi:hypothetical protein
MQSTSKSKLDSNPRHTKEIKIFIQNLKHFSSFEATRDARNHSVHNQHMKEEMTFVSHGELLLRDI